MPAPVHTEGRSGSEGAGPSDDARAGNGGTSRSDAIRYRQCYFRVCRQDLHALVMGGPKLHQIVIARYHGIHCEVPIAVMKITSAPSGLATEESRCSIICVRSAGAYQMCMKVS